MIGPVYPNIPHGFSKLGPPQFPRRSSGSSNQNTSTDTPIEGPKFSSVDGRDHIPPTTVGGYASTLSERNKVQPNDPQVRNMEAFLCLSLPRLSFIFFLLASAYPS